MNSNELGLRCRVGLLAVDGLVGLLPKLPKPGMGGALPVCTTWSAGCINIINVETWLTQSKPNESPHGQTSTSHCSVSFRGQATQSPCLSDFGTFVVEGPCQSFFNAQGSSRSTPFKEMCLQGVVFVNEHISSRGAFLKLLSRFKLLACCWRPETLSVKGPLRSILLVPRSTLQASPQTPIPCTL